jgi:hypothetical protein
MYVLRQVKLLVASSVTARNKILFSFELDMNVSWSPKTNFRTRKWATLTPWHSFHKELLYLGTK